MFIFSLFTNLKANNIIDNANILSLEFETDLEKNLVDKKSKSEVFVLTLNSLKNSPSLHELNEKLKTDENSIAALIVEPNSRKFWIVLNLKAKKIIDENEIDKAILFYVLSYFKSDKYESGIKKISENILYMLSSREKSFNIKDYDLIIFSYHINIFLVLLILGLVLLVILKIFTKASLIRSLLIISGSFFVSLFFAASLYQLFQTVFIELLFMFPSAVLSLLVDNALIVAIVVFVLISQALIKRALNPKKYSLSKSTTKRYTSSSGSSYSSYGGYSSSSSYSGGGGSFGGGGASGSW